GAFMTVCQITRNDAQRRIATVLTGKQDPGPSGAGKTGPGPGLVEPPQDLLPDLVQMAHDQIIAHIQARFAGHALSRLVEAVLEADGWVTKNSPPGADGGVDILAGRGMLGLE